MEDLAAFLKQLNKKVEEIERRLNQIECNKLVLEERKVAARQSELEGKTYTSTPEGGIVKEIRIPFCDVCGKRTENFNICVGCRSKLCEDCVVRFEGKIFCACCLNEIMPLSKTEYKTLVAIANGLKDCEKVARAAKVKESSIKKCIGELEEKGLILIKGLLLFKEVNVSDKGLEAIAAYRQIYGKEEDVKIFEMSLEGFRSEEG